MSELNDDSKPEPPPMTPSDVRRLTREVMARYRQITGTTPKPRLSKAERDMQKVLKLLGIPLNDGQESPQSGGNDRKETKR